MVGIYLIVFGVLLLIFELWAPHQVWAYMSFLRTHFGKGITLIFLGCIGGGTDALGLAVLILVLVVGFLHIIVGRRGGRRKWRQGKEGERERERAKGRERRGKEARHG